MSTLSKKISGHTEDLKKSFVRQNNPTSTKASAKKTAGFPSLNISLNVNQNMINSFFLRNELIPKGSNEGITQELIQSKSVRNIILINFSLKLQQILRI